jgi:hypothetical protein
LIAEPRGPGEHWAEWLDPGVVTASAMAGITRLELAPFLRVRHHWGTFPFWTLRAFPLTSDPAKPPRSWTGSVVPPSDSSPGGTA